MCGRQSLLTVGIALVLVLAACGGDDASPTTTEAPAATSAAPTTVATTQPADDPAGGEDRSGELVGRWEITHYVLPDGGGITNVVGDDPVFIQFNADGSVGYNTGCNSGGSSYATSGTYYVPKSALDDEPEGQPVTVGPAFEQTERGCDGFLGDQDRDLPADMGKVSRFILDGERLLLLDEFILIETTKSS